MIKDLKWDNLETRRRDTRLALLYKIIKGDAKLPHKDILKPLQGTTRNATSGRKFEVVPTRTNDYKYSFYPRTINDWNQLSNKVVNNKVIEFERDGTINAKLSVESFKLRLKAEPARASAIILRD